MTWAPRTVAGWIRAGIGLIATLTVVGAPIEVTVRLVDYPVVAPRPVVTFLTIGSCLLLVWSGLGLRRLEAERLSRRQSTLGT
jgi:hypothetical protein